MLHLHLVRTAFKGSWLGGSIHHKALSVLELSATGKYEEALEAAREHFALIRGEREKAEIAAGILETWAAGKNAPGSFKGTYRNTGAVVELLAVTPDMLRSWERNGLISVPRDPENGYRIYGGNELDRLYVIRALRKARFSLMSIRHMFNQYDRGVRKGLSGILDQLPPEEDDIVFNTNRWLTKVRGIEASARELIDRLERIKNTFKK